MYSSQIFFRNSACQTINWWTCLFTDRKIRLLQNKFEIHFCVQYFLRILFRRWKHFPGKVILAELSACVPGGWLGWRRGKGWLSWSLGGVGSAEENFWWVWLAHSCSRTPSLSSSPAPQLLAHPKLLPGSAPPPSWHREYSHCRWVHPEPSRLPWQRGGLTASFSLLLPHILPSSLQDLVLSNLAKEETATTWLLYPPSSLILWMMACFFSPVTSWRPFHIRGGCGMRIQEMRFRRPVLCFFKCEKRDLAPRLLKPAIWSHLGCLATNSTARWSLLSLCWRGVCRNAEALCRTLETITVL